MANNHNKTLSLGIIGAGDIVSKNHLPVLSSLNEIHINWITDIDLQKSQSLADAYKIPVIELPEDLHKIPPTDIVLLAIPYGARKPYYNIFKGHNTSIYVEKPFALTLEEHKEICSLFPAHRIACGFQRRSWGPTQLIKDFIKENIFGELKKIRFELGNPASFVGLADFFSNIKLAGGGILLDVGIHGIDTMLFCASAQNFELISSKMIVKNGYDIHTEAKFIINKKLNCELLVSNVIKTTNQIEFTFNDAIASYSLFDLSGKINISPIDKDKTPSLSIQNNKSIMPNTPFQTFYNHWSHFISGIKSNTANWTSAHDSFITTELIEKIYKESKGKNIK